MDRNVPGGTGTHIVMDNFAARNTVAARAQPAQRPYRHARFTPTPAAWFNQVEAEIPRLHRQAQPRPQTLQVGQVR